MGGQAPRAGTRPTSGAMRGCRPRAHTRRAVIFKTIAPLHLGVFALKVFPMRNDSPGEPRLARTRTWSCPRLTGLLLALVTLVIYLPVRQHGFCVYDDGDYVTQNQMVQNGLTWTGVKWAFTTWFASNWHPLTWLSHMLDCELFGLDPGAHHLVSVLFHAANAVLLFALLFRLTRLREEATATPAGANWAAAMVAALFAWHPLRVESVAWAAERKDVLSTFLELLALLAYAGYVQKAGSRNQNAETGGRFPSSIVQNAENRKQKTETGGRQYIFHRSPSIYYLLSLAFFALSLLAKPMPVTLPCLLLVLDWWPLRRFTIHDSRFTISPPLPRSGAISALRSPLSALRSPIFWRLAREKWPFFLLAAGSCVVTFLAQRTVAVLSLEQYPWPLRLGNALLSYTRYLLKTAWPADLAIIYPLPDHLPWLPVAASGAGLAGVSWLVWRARRAQPYLLAGWLWYLGTLVPVIGFVQAGRQAMADRYSYFPVIGILLALVWLAKDLAARFRFQGRTLAIGAGLVLAACVWQTEKQLSYWRDDESLFAHAVAVTRDNPAAQINLGMALEQQGRPAEALEHYQTALRLAPDSPEAHNNLANFLDAAGQTNEALAHYQAALRLNPNAALARCNFGTLLVKLGRLDEAMRQYQEAARLQPANPHPYYLMGKAWLRQGRSAEASRQFRHALELAPDDFESLAFLARMLATDEDPRQRDGPAAVALAEKANTLAGGSQPFILDILAMAYAEAGRFHEAQQTAGQALDLAAAAKLPDMAAGIRRHLQLYQSGLPCREAVTNTAPAGQVLKSVEALKH